MMNLMQKQLDYKKIYWDYSFFGTNDRYVTLILFQKDDFIIYASFDDFGGLGFVVSHMTKSDFERVHSHAF